MKIFVLISWLCAGSVRADTVAAVDASTTAAAVSTAPAAALAWEHTPKEVYVDGGKTFKYNGRTFALKLGFKRGDYEPFVKNFKSIPVFILTDITEGPENFKVWSAGLLESDEPFRINIHKDQQLSVLLEQDEVTVYRHVGKNKPGTKVSAFPYRELRVLWADNAARYKTDFNGKTMYFVPQAFYNESGCTSVGYVGSIDAPYFVDTGLPLDFVELFRYTKASTDRRRIAYSIPLGVIFTRTEENKKKWGLSEMRKDLLEDALAEELDSPDECNRNLREAMEKAASEK